MVRSAKSRAVKERQAFDLDYDWAIAEIERQNFRCALTGIPFFAPYDGNSRVHPFCPSLDRILPGQGYTKENVRVVIYAANVMLMDWGTQVFDKVINHCMAQKKERNRTSIAAPY
jgi:hypothetical protein